MSSKHIFISAGELSGDIHGGNLVFALKKKNPALKITAIGGDNMSAAGAELLYHIRETSFMGFAEVIGHLPFLRKLWRETLRHIDQSKPNLVVVIDYPGLNLRLAKAISKRNITTIYYISPQVWAWHQSRVKKIKKYTKMVLCILPFEEEWLKNHGVNAKFVGHPLIDQISKEQFANESLRHRNYSHLIGLFPGSRSHEVHRHLPVMIEAVHLLRNEFPNLAAAIAIAPDIDMSSFRKDHDFEWLTWVRDRNHQLMREADLLIMSSGTATLEATIFKTPMVVIYRLSGFSYRLGKLLIRVPFITIANLIADQAGIPELIQHDANAEKISYEAKALLSSSQRRAEMIRFLEKVTEKLGIAGASETAAEIILSKLP